LRWLLIIKHIDGPLGVRGRNSDNRLIKEKLGWAPSLPLRTVLEKTYAWIKKQLDNSKAYGFNREVFKEELGVYFKKELPEIAVLN
jgi:hypothetical protein